MHQHHGCSRGSHEIASDAVETTEKNVEDLGWLEDDAGADKMSGSAEEGRKLKLVRFIVGSSPSRMSVQTTTTEILVSSIN